MAKDTGAEVALIHAQELEEELQKKRESWRGLNSALDHILSGNESKLFDSILRDYTPVPQPSKAGEPIVMKAPGLSLGSVFRAIGFVFRHPIYTINFARAARAGTFTDPDFQRDLVEKPKLWSFVQKLSEKLPQIGKVLGWFGVDIFKEDKILDTKALTTLQDALTDQRVLEAAQNLTIAAMSKNPDWMQVASDGLGLLAKNLNFSQYFREQRPAIRNYAAGLIEGMIKQNEELLAQQGGDMSQSLKSQLENYGIGIADLPNIADIAPILLDQPAALRKIFDQFSKGDYIAMANDLVAMSADNPAIAQYMKDNKKLFEKVLFKAVGITDAAQEAVSASLLMAEDHKGNITDIFQILMKGENKAKIVQLLDLYQKGEWMPLIKETCRFMETDAEFNRYLNDNKDKFALIVDAVVNQSPAIKTWTAGADVGSLAGAILKDPRSIRLLVEGLEGGKVATAKAAAQVLVTKVFDSDFRNAFAGAVYNVASGWLVGGGAQKQDLVNGLLQLVSKRGDPEVQLKLSKLLQGGSEVASLEDRQREELVKLLAKKTLFDDVFIKGAEEPLKLENLRIDGTSFVNSIISNVSFKDTVFKNSSFIGATISPDVHFKGGTIDRDTLSSMVDALKNGRGNLDGVRLVGDLSGINLSGISLKGADLLGVTSMKDVDLDCADLTDAKFDPWLLVETYNLDKSKALVTPEILSAQKNRVAATLIAVACSVGELSPEVQELMLLNLEALLSSDSIIGLHARKMLESNPADILGKNFPIDPASLKHAADYRSRTGRLLTVLYDNRENPNGITLALATQIMADKVSKKLFGEGDHRGQDAALIDKMMHGVVQDFALNNRGIDPAALLANPRTEEFLEGVARDLKAKSHNTLMGKAAKLATVGLAEGGISLLKEDFTAEMTRTFAAKMRAALGENQLSDKELDTLQNMSNEIGKNLFGNGATGVRKEDVGHIFSGLRQVFGGMKEEFGSTHIDKILKDSDALIGEVNGEWRTGLTKLYHDNSTSTAAGAVTGSGGIYLDKAKVENGGFLKQVGDVIKSSAGLSYQEQVAASHITLRISANLFDGYETSGSAEYTGLIHDAISNVFAKIKEEKGGADLSAILRTQSEAIIGEMNKGWTRTVGTALTGLFLGAAKRAKGGVGARYLEKEVVEGLFDPIKEAMDQAVGARVMALDVPAPSLADSALGVKAKELARDVGVVQPVAVPKESDQPLHAAARSLAQAVDLVDGEGVSHVAGAGRSSAAGKNMA